MERDYTLRFTDEAITVYGQVPLEDMKALGDMADQLGYTRVGPGDEYAIMRMVKPEYYEGDKR